MRFRVRFYAPSGHGLAAKDKNGLSDPYVVLRFDEAVEVKTPVVYEDLNPSWPDFTHTFIWEEMGGSDALRHKHAVLVVMDKDRLSKDDEIGRCSVDLYSVATGPVKHCLTLLKRGRDGGVLRFALRMEEQGSALALFRSVRLTGVPMPKSGGGGGVRVRGASSLPQSKHFVRSEAQPVSESEWPQLDALRLTAPLEALMTSSVRFEVLDTSAGGPHEPVLATAAWELRRFQTFEDGDALRVRERLFPVAGTRGGDDAWLEAEVVFRGWPRFAQWIDGVHEDRGIVGGRPYHARVHQPTLAVYGAAGDAAPSARPAHELPPRAKAATASPPSPPSPPSPRAPLPMGKAGGVSGFCCVCARPSDYLCSETQKPVCCKQCKIANLGRMHVREAMHAPPPVPPKPQQQPRPVPVAQLAGQQQQQQPQQPQQQPQQPQQYSPSVQCTPRWTFWIVAGASWVVWIFAVSSETRRWFLSESVLSCCVCFAIDSRWMGSPIAGKDSVHTTRIKKSVCIIVRVIRAAKKSVRAMLLRGNCSTAVLG